MPIERVIKFEEAECCRNCKQYEDSIGNDVICKLDCEIDFKKQFDTELKVWSKCENFEWYSGKGVIREWKHK